jgi:RhtB (resistance to homoserine/threonine) family protein
MALIDSQVLAFTVVAAALTIAPGADTMLVLRNVLQGGRAHGMVTTVGICSGLLVHATLSALGLSVLLLHSATAFHVVKIGGAAYLVWLGWQSLRGALRSPEPAPPNAAPAAPVALRRRLLEGFLCNVLNPKVAVFYLALLPQFIGPADPVLAKALLLAGIHYAEGIVWLLGVSLVVDRARRFVLQARVRRWLDALCGVALLGLGARLALERR